MNLENKIVTFDGTYWVVNDEYVSAKKLVTIDEVKAVVNESKAKRAAVQSALDNGMYAAAVMLRLPLHRLGMLNLYTRNGMIPPEKAWRIARDSWLDVDNVSCNRIAWAAFFKEFFDTRQHFMSDKENEHFAALPDQIKIYRGYKGKSRAGLSWTMSKMIASQYSPSYGGAIVAQGMVNKSDVVGYITARGHHEIVLRSEDVVLNQRAVNAVRPEEAMKWVIMNKGVFL